MKPGRYRCAASPFAAADSPNALIGSLRSVAAVGRSAGLRIRWESHHQELTVDDVSITRYIADTFDGVDVVTASRETGAPEVAWGDTLATTPTGL